MGNGLEEKLTLPLLAATQAAALACQPHFGRGDKEAADEAAVDALRRVLNEAPGEGVVVIGEGEKDEAPMLYNGEALGSGGEPGYDIAVDPLEGTKFMAEGLPGAVAVLAVAERGALWSPGPGFYMDKLVVGAGAREAEVDIRLEPEENLERVAGALGKKVEEVRVFVLDKDRHEDFVERIREFGAAVVAQPDGDVEGSLQALIPEGEVDVLMGIGGTPEGVISASAARVLGGDMQVRLAPQDGDEREALEEAGFEVGQVFTLDELVRGETLFVATGVSGQLLRRPWQEHGVTWTESLMLKPGGRIMRVVESAGQVEGEAGSVGPSAATEQQEG